MPAFHIDMLSMTLAIFREETNTWKCNLASQQMKKFAETSFHNSYKMLGSRHLRLDFDFHRIFHLLTYLKRKKTCNPVRYRMMLYFYYRINCLIWFWSTNQLSIFNEDFALFSLVACEYCACIWLQQKTDISIVSSHRISIKTKARRELIARIASSILSASDRIS